MDRYEELRRRVTDGGPGNADGLVLLRRQGVHAWIAHVAAALPPRPSQEGTSSAFRPTASTLDRTPIVSVCSDMLLATLNTQEVR